MILKARFCFSILFSFITIPILISTSLPNSRRKDLRRLILLVFWRTIWIMYFYIVNIYFLNLHFILFFVKVIFKNQLKYE